MTGDRTTRQADALVPVRRPRYLRIAALIAFGLFYAYDLFEAISTIFAVTDQIARYNAAAAEVGLNAVAVPWALLIGIVVVPVATFVATALLGRRRGLGVAALLLLAGLAVSAAVTLSLTALA
jgi:hypothetical protein